MVNRQSLALLTTKTLIPILFTERNPFGNGVFASRFFTRSPILAIRLRLFWIPFSPTACRFIVFFSVTDHPVLSAFKIRGAVLLILAFHGFFAAIRVFPVTRVFRFAFGIVFAPLPRATTRTLFTIRDMTISISAVSVKFGKCFELTTSFACFHKKKSPRSE